MPALPRKVSGHGEAGAGYYVVVEGSLSDRSDTHELHVFRARDGKRWLVPKPDGTEPGGPLYVDASEIWYSAERDKVLATVVRQRIEDLVEVELDAE
jgi:hypothetical protein